MANAQRSRLDHSTYTCFKCGQEKRKSEIFKDGFQYVCGDCQ